MEEPKRNPDPADLPALPPTIQMAKNFVKAVVKHVSDGLAKVTVQQYMDRIAKCNDCKLRLQNRCTHPKCGCFIELKAWWASEDCPDDPPRWPRLE